MDGKFVGISSLPLLIEIKSEANNTFPVINEGLIAQQFELLLQDQNEIEISPNLKNNFNMTIINDMTKDNNVPIPIEKKCKMEYNCIDCSEKFESEEVYDIHMRGHANNKKCSICNMVLKSLKNYEKHCLRCKPYECQICGRVVRFRPNFIKHMRVHTSQQSERHKYKCEVCHKEFMSFEYFKVHKKIHSQNVNLTCEICGKVFSALASLRGHTRLHTGVKLHKCEVCGKAFGQRYNLKIHSRVHGVILYECNVCKSKFSTSEQYKEHIAMHKNENKSIIIKTEPNMDVVTIKTEENDNLFDVDTTQMEHNLQEACQPHKINKLTNDEISEYLPVPVNNIESQNCQYESSPLDNDLLDNPTDDIYTNQDVSLICRDPSIECSDNSMNGTHFSTAFNNDLIDPNCLSDSLSYSNLFETNSFSENVPEEILESDKSFQLTSNFLTQSQKIIENVDEFIFIQSYEPNSNQI